MSNSEHAPAALRHSAVRVGSKPGFPFWPPEIGAMLHANPSAATSCDRRAGPRTGLTSRNDTPNVSYRPYSISFDHPLLRHQSRTLRISEESFVEEIAPARTFGFLKEVELLRRNGLALGGSLDNAIVLGETGVLNALRFEDEFVRHKILDVIGDLALVGYPIIGHLVAHRGGHALHTSFAAKILEDAEAWRLVEGRVDPAAAETPVAIPVKSGMRLAT